MPRNPYAEPSTPHIQFRAASMRHDLDARRIPGESYAHTVQWCLRQYFDLMSELDHEDHSALRLEDVWVTDCQRREGIATGTITGTDYRAPTRAIAEEREIFLGKPAWFRKEE